MSFVTPIHGNSFDFTSITIQETIDALNQIKSKKYPGLDGISTRLLKDATNIIAGPRGGSRIFRTLVKIL
jgi:hypothetical protein